MLKGRESESKKLKDIYSRTGSHVLVVYGLKGVGKSSLIRDFVEENKLGDTALICNCRELTVREQLYQWKKTLPFEVEEEFPGFATFFDKLENHFPKDRKRIIIFDEFHWLLKYSREFTDCLFEFLKKSQGQNLVLLVSSSIGWVENSIVEKIGPNARGINGFMKINELGFGAFREYFKGWRYDDIVSSYAILGGIPQLWQYFDKDLNLKGNVVSNILNPSSRLYTYGEDFVNQELREIYVYNGILSALAEGKNKLNDLFIHTGFSRPKISVYMKNLMELGILTKEFSVDTEGRKNTKKGIYDIAVNYIDFYYRFLFSSKEELEATTAQSFFNSNIKPALKNYTGKYFPAICREYLEEQNQLMNLPIKYERLGTWIGKTGTIDFVCRDRIGQTLVGLCNWEKPLMGFKDYEWLLFCMKQAKIKGDFIYLFSAGGYDEELKFATKSRQNIRLVSIDEL